VPNVGIFRKGFWQIVAICFAAFLFSAGLRLIEYPRWDQSNFKVDGEWLLATHDAYFWVAGAEGVNPIAEPMPMAILLDVLSRIFPIPLGRSWERSPRLSTIGPAWVSTTRIGRYYSSHY